MNEKNKVIAKALSMIYTSPEQAFMDGSYKQVKEALIFVFSETEKLTREEILKIIDDKIDDLKNESSILFNGKPDIKIMNILEDLKSEIAKEKK